MTTPDLPEASARRPKGDRETSTDSTIGQSTFADLAEEFGIPSSRWPLGPIRLADAVQRSRRMAGTSARAGVTRSVLLWALSRESAKVGSVMSNAGLEPGGFAELLGGVDLDLAVDVELPVSDILFGPSLVAALRRHLDAKGVVTDVDLARALLRSATEDSGVGALGSRLQRLGVDVPGALLDLDALAASIGGPADRVPDALLSQSVRGVRDRLGPATPVTASRIAHALQAGHPGYGAGAFGSVTLRPDDGERRTTDAWLHAVRDLYDMDAVTASRHRVLDGLLVIVGLAELDPQLAADLEPGGVLTALRAEATVPTSGRASGRRPAGRSDRTEWSPDSPATVDLLGRAALAKMLADRVKRLDDGPYPRESFLVHIDGPWGSGKSSLFAFLSGELERDFLIVPVNAWREQRVGVQWWTLLSALQRAIARDAGMGDRVRNWAEAMLERMRARWLSLVLALVVVAGLVMAALLLGFGEQEANAILAWISLATVVFAGLVAGARFLWPGARRSAESLIEKSENPSEEIMRLFARTLLRAPKPVVFLIDDLDRCDAEYVVEFLEVVQTLVRGAAALVDEDRKPRRRPRVPGAATATTNETHAGAHAHTDKRISGPYGFIAADGRWIRASYEAHYERFGTTESPGRPLGYLFLEKVFQLRVLLPAVRRAARDAYLRTLLRTSARAPVPDVDQDRVVAEADAAIADARNQQDLASAGRLVVDQVEDARQQQALIAKIVTRFSEESIEEATTSDLSPFAELLDPNPRSMKLFVNTYGVLQSVRALEEVFPDTSQLALWTVVEVRWPELADFLRSHPTTIDDLIAGRALSAEAIALLGQEGVLRVFEDPGWGHLDADVIRACAGVT